MAVDHNLTLPAFARPKVTRFARGASLALAFLALAGFTGFIGSARAQQQAEQWVPVDLPFSAPSTVSNPFAVKFSADITGPAGARLTLPGFYDGANTWKIRFSAPIPGRWQIVTHSDAPALDGKTVAVQCVPNPSKTAHGGIKVDPQHPHEFIYDDDTPWRAPVGYECDWLWALDAGDPTLKTINPFLDKLAANGFNWVLMDTYAYDTTWRAGKTGPDDYGPPPMYAWAGTNDAPDFTRFNLNFWQHFDRVVDALNRRGIAIHLFFKVYNKGVNYPALGSSEDDLYFRWVIARYAAYPNMTWDLSKEAQHETSRAYKVDRLKFIRATDPYHRLLTVHDDKAEYDGGTYDGLVDYRSDQQHLDWHATMLAHLARNEWPVVNTELGYEQGPGGPKDKTYSRAQAPEEVVRRAWQVCVAGGYATYYYTYTAWDVLRPEATPPGYAYFKNLSAFWSAIYDRQMTSSDSLVSTGDCLANPGHEYVVFEDAATPFTLTVVAGSATPLAGEWFDPLSGKRIKAGVVAAGADTLTPPAELGLGPVVFHAAAAVSAR